MTVELACDRYLSGEMHRDATLMENRWLTEFVEVVHTSVLHQYAQVGGDVSLSVHHVDMCEPVMAIEVSTVVVLVERQIDSGMLQHCRMLAGDHALHKRPRRVGSLVILTLVAHSAAALHLTVDTVRAGLLLPYLERRLIDLHVFVVLLLAAKLRNNIETHRRIPSESESFQPLSVSRSMFLG